MNSYGRKNRRTRTSATLHVMAIRPVTSMVTVSTVPTETVFSALRQRIGMMMLGLLDRMEVLHIIMIHMVVYMIPTVLSSFVMEIPI